MVVTPDKRSADPESMVQHPKWIPDLRDASSGMTQFEGLPVSIPENLR
jgi:hypothetical protein